MGLLLITKPVLELAVALNKVLKPDETLSALLETETGNAVIGTRAFFVVVQQPPDEVRDAWPVELLNDVGDSPVWMKGNIVIPGGMIAEALKMMPKDKAFQSVAFGHAWPTIDGEALQAKAWIVDGKTVKTIMHPQPETPMVDWKQSLRAMHQRITGRPWDLEAGLGGIDLLRITFGLRLVEALSVVTKAAQEMPDAKAWGDAIIHNGGRNDGFIVRMANMLVCMRAAVVKDEVGFNPWESATLNAIPIDETASWPMLAAEGERRKLPPKKAPPPRQLPPRKTA